jgi:hypothetical protein
MMRLKMLNNTMKDHRDSRPRRWYVHNRNANAFYVGFLRQSRRICNDILAASDFAILGPLRKVLTLNSG